MSSPWRFAVVDGGDPQQLLTGLTARTRLVADRPRSVRRTRLDTFDWRLHGDGSWLDLVDRAGRRTLAWTGRRGENLGHLDLGDQPTAEPPRFAWDLPAGPVTDRLADLLEMRALLPLATIDLVETELRLVDGEHKTVARLRLEQRAGGAERTPSGDSGSPATGGPAAPAGVLTVLPVRGYDRQARALGDLLASQVLLEAADEDLLDRAVRDAGHRPGAYSPKLRLALDPACTADEAWRAVLRALFATQRANEAGLRDDLDSEFLHDFRVAVRRTRAVLTAARGVLDAGVLDRFRPEFAWLGAATGPTRDLDVYLLGVPGLERALPDGRRHDLKAFRAFLERRQQAAHRTLVEQLDSRRYRQFIQAWSAELEEGADTGGAAEADRPANEVAGRRIWQAHRRLVRRGRAITEDTEPEALHELRKDAKKLRYLLECFGSLWPADEVSPVVRRLKSLQEVLGDYQDSQVQIGSLEDFGQQMLDESPGLPAATLLAMGTVVEHLHETEIAAREGFAARFAEYDNRALRRRVRATFVRDPDLEQHEGPASPPPGRQGSAVGPP